MLTICIYYRVFDANNNFHSDLLFSHRVPTNAFRLECNITKILHLNSQSYYRVYASLGRPLLIWDCFTYTHVVLAANIGLRQSHTYHSFQSKSYHSRSCM